MSSILLPNQRRIRGTSRFKGVHFAKGRQRAPWHSQIRVGGMLKTVGYFSNERDAAIAWDKAAIAYRGSDTTTNAVIGLLETLND